MIAIQTSEHDRYDSEMVTSLADAVRARFLAVNGEHPMTPEDDAYVSDWYVTIEELARRTQRDPEELRALMLANRLPLPSYIRTDGAQMVPADLLALLESVDDPDELPGWFARHWEDPSEATEEWDAYLSGGYVCLRHVSPATIQRKGALVAAISARVADPAPEDEAWLEELHALVDELDAIEPPFAPYDRLRFGGPVSRDTCIDDVRRAYPRPAAVRA
jgi:Family of unknown function (DUF6058)